MLHGSIRLKHQPEVSREMNGFFIQRPTTALTRAGTWRMCASHGADVKVRALSGRTTG
jgi:hypothetical protein